MIYIFINIEEIKNTLREFQAENGRKFKNTQAELKKVVSYKKKCICDCLLSAVDDFQLQIIRDCP